MTSIARIYKIIIGVIIAVLAVGIVVWFFVRSGGKNENPGAAATSTPLAAQVASPVSAYVIALARAKQWESDAAPMEVDLNDASGGQWTFTFVSQKNKGEGFRVAVDGSSILEAQQITFEGSGIALPDNVIDPNAAIAEARAVPGFGSAIFVSLQMIYNAAAKQWYWGVKTSAGATITVKATP